MEIKMGEERIEINVGDVRKCRKGMWRPNQAKNQGRPVRKSQGKPILKISSSMTGAQTRAVSFSRAFWGMPRQSQFFINHSKTQAGQRMTIWGAEGFFTGLFNASRYLRSKTLKSPASMLLYLS